ncbi:vacuolar protein sorting protein 28 [Ramicandelaber brevisporus]|nr:vacuolar protein sorting protein 28 [Ramicandelaber brevisporus]
MADVEVRLFNSNAERERLESLADLYSIILSLEHLERAFTRDAIDAHEYTPACQRLLTQYKVAFAAVEDHIRDVDDFVKQNGLRCTAALGRLRSGIPLTLEHGGMPTVSLGGISGGTAANSSSHNVNSSTAAHAASGGAGSGSSTEKKAIADTVHHFITLTDRIRLGMVAVDQLHPDLVELMQSINNVTSLPPSYEGRARIRDWLITLNGMRASDTLTKDQERQLLFDIDSAQNAFYRSLDP